MHTTVSIADPIQTSLLDRSRFEKTLGKFTLTEGALLIHIPQIPLELLDYETAKNRGYLSYPPQGLLYLSAIFRSLGILTHIVDLNHATLREAQNEFPNMQRAWQRVLDKAFKKFKSPFVGISYMFDVTYPELKNVSDYIRDNGPNVGISVGGVAASADPGVILRNNIADLVFSHEGEESIKHLYRYLRKENDDLPPNLSFLDSNGKLINTYSLVGGEVDYDIRSEYKKIKIK